MRSGKSQFSLALALVVCAACSSKAPCFEHTNGKQYHIGIVERWDESSQYPGWPGGSTPCPTDFDLVPGSGFDIRITGFNQDAEKCSCGMGVITTSPPGWSWNGAASDQRCEGRFFTGAYTAERDGCNGGPLSLSIDSTQVPSTSPTVGQYPPARLHRTFAQGPGFVDGGCIQPSGGLGGCDDAFVIEIQEL